MDAELLKTMIIAGVALILGVPILRMIRAGRISSASFSKEGGLRLDMTAMNKRDESRYFMDRRISEIDEALRVEARSIAHNLRRPILRAVADSGLCSAALRAIAGDLRGPIFQATDENDFKNRLALRNVEDYLAEKVEMIKDEYADLLTETSVDPCVGGPSATLSFPGWDAIRPAIEKAVKAWGAQVAEEVVRACKKKISVYEEYKPRFEEAKDEYFVDITTKCIEKNANYIRELGGDL